MMLSDFTTILMLSPHTAAPRKTVAPRGGRSGARRLRHTAGPRGFSLVELLVVVAVVAVLMGLTLPAMSAARREAQRTVCGSNLHQLGLVGTMYLNEYRQTFWPYYTDSAAGRQWWFGFEPGGPGSSMTPNRPLDTSRSIFAPYMATISDYFQCPTFPYRDPNYFAKFDHHAASYGYNVILGGGVLPTTPMTLQAQSGREANVFLFTDAIHYDFGARFNEGHYVQWINNATMASGYAHFRHNQVTQYVLLDGHVENQQLQGRSFRSVDGWTSGNLAADDGGNSIYGY